MRVPLTGVPAGLVALVRPGKDGRPPRDRKGRITVKRAVLARGDTGTTLPPGEDPGVLPEGDWRWMTSATSRRWRSVVDRLGSRAWTACTTLAALGVLQIDVTVDVPRVGAPTAVRLTPSWAAAAQVRTGDRSAARDDLRRRADDLASRVEAIDSGLAAALGANRAYRKTLPVLLAAAQDLLDGTTHDGPRAFSQNHFGTTKTHDDAPWVLREAGASSESLAALGLTRSPYLGLGGAITVTGDGGVGTDLRHHAGPVRYRVVPAARFVAELVPRDRTVTLVVVENLQAAEAVCDTHGAALAVAWCAGQPADGPLDLVVGLADGARRVLICPDADWGGVRIAARIVEKLPEGTPCDVLDPGTAPHRTREPFGPAAREGLARIAASASRPEVRDFARAVVERGYPVEQEASARHVLARALDESRPS